MVIAFAKGTGDQGLSLYVSIKTEAGFEPPVLRFRARGRGH
jgi:hypothetical protein